jgi:hypothetical protein
MVEEWLTYSPTLKSREEVLILRRAARALAKQDNAAALKLADKSQADGHVAIEAALRVLTDLAGHGWRVRVETDRIAIARPTQTSATDDEQREKIRAQHMRARDAQLRNPAARSFVESMETRRIHDKRFVSIFSLMRDGRELSTAIRAAQRLSGADRVQALRQVVRPYLQVANDNALCEFTGLRLADVWRYFRYTWANHSVSIPGRSMMILVRDAAAPNHPVIGIAALGSSVVQNSARDRWIGWEPDVFSERITTERSHEVARWLVSILERAFDTTYVEDFLAEGDITYRDLKEPTEEAISRMEELSRLAKQRHHRGSPLDHKRKRSQELSDEQYWQAEAQSDLFKSKRAALLATLLRARRLFKEVFSNEPSGEQLLSLLKSGLGKQVVNSLVRKAKSEIVGISIADITVCGAIAPYNHLLGGKLVAMLLTSPEVVIYYRDRYADYKSIIASSMAGRPINKPPLLVVLATTSLYGIPLSQYTRISIPCEIAGGPVTSTIRYQKLGETIGYGSFHFSVAARKALSTLCAQSSNGATVNFIFGEGVSPSFRAIRDGLDELGLPSDQLLNHGSPKIAYGVSLASNALEYLLGMHPEPTYLIPIVDPRRQTDQIAEWWTERWLSGRIQREDVLAQVESETMVHPIRHAARVSLPVADSDQLQMFDD